MNKASILLLLLMIGSLSCQSFEQEVDIIEIAEKYYQFLDHSDTLGMESLLNDSIVIRERQDEYEERFSKRGYIEWLKWDAVFDPTYEVLELAQDNGMVIAKVSKVDKRLGFLLKEPIIWRESIQFDADKIIHVERIEYEVFDVTEFLQNRDALTDWIKENHPELDGFLYEQTEAGGMKYLKAINLYQNRN